VLFRSQGTTTWSFTAGGQADADKVNSLVNGLISFTGTDFDTSPDAAKALTASPQATIAIATSDGKDFALLIVARREGDQYPCTIRGISFVYLVPEWRVDQALPTRESLMPQAR
jgi:hypothetical protein